MKTDSISSPSRSGRSVVEMPTAAYVIAVLPRAREADPGFIPDWGFYLKNLDLHILASDERARRVTVMATPEAIGVARIRLGPRFTVQHVIVNAGHAANAFPAGSGGSPSSPGPAGLPARSAVGVGRAGSERKPS